MSAASADLSELAADLRAAGDQAPNLAHNLVRDTASTVVQLASAKAPRKSGTLANSIHVRWDGDLVAYVGPGVRYGVYQEFGTGTRGEFGGDFYQIKPKAASVLVFTIGGRTVYAKTVNHPGIRPHPYMRPALIEALGPMAEKLAERGMLSITKGPKAVFS